MPLLDILNVKWRVFIKIKNWGKLKKQGLTTSILKLESSNAERDYMKHFNTNVDYNNVDNNNNNNNNNNNTDDDDDEDDGDTYDGKIWGKISDVRMILSRLGNTITVNDRKKLKKSFMKYKIRKIFQIRKKKRIMIILLS